MPWARPTLTDLQQQAIQDITTSGLPGLTGLLRAAVLRVLAWAMAGLAYLVYGYGDWIARMGVPFTAENEFLYAWAALIGVYPKGATPATGTAQFTGNPGRKIPHGTQLIRADGTTYQTTADATMGGTQQVTVPIAATIAGGFTNDPGGTTIAIAAPIIGINSNGFTGECTGGADAETQDQLRTRMLFQYRNPPQGGDADDYEIWALQVPGCTRAWTFGNALGPGTVSVFVMFDGEIENNGFPVGSDGVSPLEPREAISVASGDQRTVADHIYPLQPVTAMVYVVGPRPQPIDVTLEALSPNSIDAQQAVIAALSDMMLVEGSPGCTLYPSQFYEAILAIPGIESFILADPDPTQPIRIKSGFLPVMGNLNTT
jgi:uncharacterized phage protein gp47/JayE